jgi:hypothetical protein
LVTLDMGFTLVNLNGGVDRIRLASVSEFGLNSGKCTPLAAGLGCLDLEDADQV